jgi:acetolactate synthase I/III small subunit
MTESISTLTPQQIIRRKAAGHGIMPGELDASKRHVISVKLENSIGALIRVVNMFSARGFNLESVAVGETDDPEVSRMTIVTRGDNRTIAQVNRQLDRLIDVLEIDDVTDDNHVERELCLVTAGYTADSRSEILDTLEIFRGKVVDITPRAMTFELTGPPAKISAFIELLRPHGIRDITRSGRIAIRRSDASYGADG